MASKHYNSRTGVRFSRWDLVAARSTAKACGLVIAVNNDPGNLDAVIDIAPQGTPQDLWDTSWKLGGDNRLWSIYRCATTFQAIADEINGDRQLNAETPAELLQIIARLQDVDAKAALKAGGEHRGKARQVIA